MPTRSDRRAGGVVLPVLALAALGLLAACGQTPQASRPVTAASQPRPATPPGPPGDPWGPWIREASARFDVPEAWIREVMRQESGGRAGVTSRAGAMGLMQVMPGTYRELQARYGLGDDPYHPYDNLMAGTAYIREMYDLFGSPAFLAAYNAGPRRLEDFLYNRRGLPAETRNYVARVGPGVLRQSPGRRAPSEIYAAAEIPLQIPPGPRRMDQATRIALAEQRAIREGGARMMAQAPSPPPAAAPRPAPVALAATAPPISRQGGVVAMAPIPDGSTPEGAARLAGQEIWPDGRIVVARMDPIPDGSTPEGAARLAEAEARAAGTTPMPPALPAGRLAPPAPRLVAAVPPPAARPAPRGLGLIGTAQAGTLPAGLRPAVAVPAQWGVQVGAYRSPDQARRAAAGVQSGTGGRVEVTPVTVAQGTLFRARVVGLNERDARQTCDRLRARGGCALISPGS